MPASPQWRRCVSGSFLMYRVELKFVFPVLNQPASPVPNVPCGVEMRLGVVVSTGREKGRFLMYRVELKFWCEGMLKLFEGYVPNVPCGVEMDFLTFVI